MNAKQGRTINAILGLSVFVGSLLLIAGVITQKEFVFGSVPAVAIAVLIGKFVLKQGP